MQVPLVTLIWHWKCWLCAWTPQMHCIEIGRHLNRSVFDVFVMVVMHTHTQTRTHIATASVTLSTTAMHAHTVRTIVSIWMMDFAEGIRRLGDSHFVYVLLAKYVTQKPSHASCMHAHVHTPTRRQMLVVTPGSGNYTVSKSLLNLTRQRVIDDGVGCDMVSLADPALHLSPLFRYTSVAPHHVSVAAMSRWCSSTRHLHVCISPRHHLHATAAVLGD